MTDELLSRIFVNQWLVVILVSALLLTFAEIGYRLGLASRQRNETAAENLSGIIQGAVLGLLGLLLGFSFSMSVSRYDARRSLVVEEANSIGTTWLRADFLSDAHRAAVRNLLRDYTKTRIDGFSHDPQSAGMKKIRSDVARSHQSLWKHAAAAVQENPSPAVVSFVTSLNETIDLDTSRMAASRNHVPSAVWLLLIVVSGCGAWSSGYVCGSGGIRSVFSQWIFPLLIGVVITLISDIDRPTRGMVGISQKPLMELLESFD